MWIKGSCDFYGLPAEDLKVQFIHFNSRDLIVGSKVKGDFKGPMCVIMSNINTSDIDSDVTLTEKSMKWYYDTIVMPFVRTWDNKSTEREKACMIEHYDIDLIHSETSILKIYSEMLCLNYLKMSETMEKNKRASTIITKIGGPSADNSQALDVGEYFRYLVRQMAKLTMKSDDSLLKKIFTNMLSECN